MNQAELDALSRMARLGDQEAASRVLVHLLPILNAVSRREARGLVEAEDLQAHAIENLLRLWSKGEGPETDVSGYLIRSMRNRVIDESRSPRSKTRNFAEDEDFEAPGDDPALGVELDRERRWLHGALARLAPDQQRLLTGIYVEDLKPAQLADELGRSPNAVYALHRRSRLALRRAFLQEVLVERAPQECAQAAEDIPERVEYELEQTTASSAGMRHILGCVRCQRAWRRFGSVTSVLGVSGILMLTYLRPEPAAALAGGAAAGSAPAGNEGAQARSADGTGGAAGHAPTAEAETARYADDGALGRAQRWRKGTVAAALGAVAGVVIGFAVCHFTEPILPPAPAGQLAITIGTSDRIEVGVDFAIDRESWQYDRFELEFPSSLELMRSPDGWGCMATRTLLRCTGSQEFPLEGAFVFEGDPALGEELSLAIEATAEGHQFRGYAHSEIPPPGSTTTTRAEVLAGG